MKFNIKKSGENLLGMARRLGYIPQKTTASGESAFIRPIQREFPRFHLYIRETPDEFIFNLHLDQKKPSYGAETAHSGEYDGELVTDEANRIKQIFLKTESKLIVPKPAINDDKEKTSKLAGLFKKMFS